MCGIVGFVDKKTQSEKAVIIKDMMDAIIHRGPNSAGQYIDDDVALGFRRLSIIDLEGGSQPLYNEEKTKVLTFNGEIYNYQSIRKELVEKGYHFKTNTDSEVLIHGYQEYGVALLQKLRGMFAFVIWDTEKKELFGARDHFGIKPFYYYNTDEVFMYGSEIKSFLHHPSFKKELNKEALKPYLTFQYPATKECFFKNVYRLPEGHYFILKDGKLDIQQYWDLHQEEKDMTLEEAVNFIDETVQESVATHKIADVEVGSFLSSGVDSSLVASILKPAKTYSVGFGSSYNESTEAKALTDILGLHNTSRTLTGEEAFQYFPQIQYYLDEPDSNPSVVPLFFLSELAARDVKVVMSGEGADELFAGYIDYGWHSNSMTVRKLGEALKKLSQSKRHKLSEHLKKLPNFPGKLHLLKAVQPAEEYFIGQALVFTEEEASAIVKPEYRNAPSVKEIVMDKYAKVKNLSEIKKMQYLDMHQWMPGDILLKADKMSMAHSLELRVPLLDKKMMECAQVIPTKYLFNEHNTKYAFRQAAFRHIPKEWAARPKLGFPVPIKDWLRTEKFYQIVRAELSKDFVGEFFDQKAVLQLLDDNFQGKVDARRKIWTLYTFITWYDIYFIQGGNKPQVA